MKYYFIRQPSDKKIVGVNDGAAQAEIIESKCKNKKELKRYYDEYVLDIAGMWEKIKNGEVLLPPTLEYIKVRPQAIITDFLTFSEAYAGGEYLISEKVRNIIGNFNISCRIYDPIGLYHKDKKVEGYCNLHLLPLESETAFNFGRSTFYTGSRFLGKTFRYANSFEEYLALRKEAGIVNYEVLALNKSSIGDLDMFNFDYHPRIYVSERLKTALESAGVTSIQFLEPNEPGLEIV